MGDKNILELDSDHDHTLCISQKQLCCELIIHIHTCTYTYIHIIHICTYTHMHLYTYIHVHLYAYIHIHLYTYIHIYKYKYKLCGDSPLSPRLYLGLELLGQLVSLCLYLVGPARLFLHND